MLLLMLPSDALYNAIVLVEYPGTYMALKKKTKKKHKNTKTQKQANKQTKHINVD